MAARTSGKRSDRLRPTSEVKNRRLWEEQVRLRINQLTQWGLELQREIWQISQLAERSAACALQDRVSQKLRKLRSAIQAARGEVAEQDSVEDRLLVEEQLDRVAQLASHLQRALRQAKLDAQRQLDKQHMQQRRELLAGGAPGRTPTSAP
eukprot:g50955.t1